MNIDFIKWLCDKAEGFVFYEYDEFDIEIETPCSENSFTDIGSLMANDAFYPLLLQRAIEGVNRESKYTVNQYHNSIPVCKNGYAISVPFDLECFDSNDKAKESALQYIYEQEHEK